MKNKNTGVVTMDQVNIKNVPTLLEQVNSKLASLKQTNDVDFKNILEIEIPKIGKLKNCKSVEKIISVGATLLAKSEYHTKSCENLELDISKHPFKYEGFSLSKWQEALKARISNVINIKQIEKLKKTKSILEQHLSKEEKFKKDMASIVDILKD